MWCNLLVGLDVKPHLDQVKMVIRTFLFAFDMQKPFCV